MSPLTTVINVSLLNGPLQWMKTVMMYVYLSYSIKSACLWMPEPTSPNGHIPLLYYAMVPKENSQNVVWPARTVWVMLGMPISNAEQVSEQLHVVRYRYTVCRWIGWCGTLMCATSYLHMFELMVMCINLYIPNCVLWKDYWNASCVHLYLQLQLPLYTSCTATLQHMHGVVDCN